MSIHGQGHFMMTKCSKIRLQVSITGPMVLWFSLPEPKAHRWAYRIGRHPASVRHLSSVRLHQPFSKIFSSETPWSIRAKFYMKHLWEGGTNVYINNLGHMTKMATMPIYIKNPWKIFSSGTGWPTSTKLGMKHWWLKYYNVYINHDPVMTLTYFMARST